MSNLMDQIAGVQLWLPTAFTRHMHKEDFTAVPSAAPAVDGDTVGIIESPAGGHTIYAPSSGTKPVLASDTAPSSLSSLHFTGSTKQLVVNNSDAALNFIGFTRLFSVAFKIKFDNAAATAIETICDNNKSASANSGLNITRALTTGAMTIVLTWANAGQFILLTGTAILDTNEHTVIITCTSGTNGFKIYVDGTLTQTTLTGTPIAVDAPFDLYLGVSNAVINRLKGKLSNFLITNTVMSDAERTTFTNYNPARTGASLVKTNSGDALHPLDVLNFRHTRLLPSDLTTMWTTSAKATQVAANGDKVGYIESAWPTVTKCDYKRYFNQSTDAKRPAYSTTETPAGILYAGASANPDSPFLDYTGEQDLVARVNWPRGNKTYFWVLHNTKADPGSHMLMSNSQYSACVGSDYPGTPGNGLVSHSTNGAAYAPVSAGGGEVKHIFALRVDNAKLKVWLDNVSSGENVAVLGVVTPLHIGRPWNGQPGYTWDIAGSVCEVDSYNAALTDEQVRRVINGLSLDHDVPYAYRAPAGGMLLTGNMQELVGNLGG